MSLIKTSVGLDWHVDCEGTGVPLVFIHGWGVDSRIWRQQVKHFSKKFKVIAIDLPGHGKSSWRQVNLQMMAEGLKEVCDQLNLKGCIFVGSSFGGMLSLKLFSVAPDLFEKMVFVGSTPKFSKSEDYPHGLDIDKIRKLDGQVEHDYPGIINVFFRSLFTKEERSTRRYKWLQKFKRTDAAPMKPALRAYLDILERADLRDVLPSLRLPTQFITGREDTICNAGTVAFLQRLCPCAQFDFFEKCGHFPFLSQPHEFNEVLEGFLTAE
ncbi:alpha/beta fold hydrolase [Candidatus Omnitrophota bacterium]